MGFTHGPTPLPRPSAGVFFEMNDNDRITAVHEAGHALVGHLVGHLVERAFIGVDPEGAVPAGTADGGIALRLVGDWRHAVIVAVAGWCAEEVIFPGSQADRGQDEVFCRDALCQAGFSEWHSDAFIEWATAIVKDQIRVRRSTLEAVADWLTLHRDIHSETLAALVRAHDT